MLNLKNSPSLAAKLVVPFSDLNFSFCFFLSRSASTSRSIMSSCSLASNGSAQETSLPNYTYQIIRNAQGQLEFEPEEGSEALSDATRVAFPLERDPERRMSLAIRKFLSTESASPTVTQTGSLIRRDSSTSQQSRTALPRGRKSRSKARRRRAYSPVSRAIVGANRGKVCPKHREKHELVSIASQNS